MVWISGFQLTLYTVVIPGACYGDYVAMIRQNMQKAHEVAGCHLVAAAKRQTEGYDAKLSFHTYKTRDYVWCSMEIELSMTRKLCVPFKGPSLVIQPLTDLAYQSNWTDPGPLKSCTTKSQNNIRELNF